MADAQCEQLAVLQHRVTAIEETLPKLAHLEMEMIAVKRDLQLLANSTINNYEMLVAVEKRIGNLESQIDKKLSVLGTRIGEVDTHIKRFFWTGAGGVTAAGALLTWLNKIGIL
ncbi:MAG: hypothetical protein AAGI24_04185 [Pseudomonadota bacterium]